MNPIEHAIVLMQACDGDTAKALEYAELNRDLGADRTDSKYWAEVVRVIEALLCVN